MIKHEAILQFSRFLNIYLIISISNIETVYFQILHCVGLVMFDSAVSYLLMAGNLGI